MTRPDFWALMRQEAKLTNAQMAELAGPGLIEAAREWIADVQWANDFDADDLTPGQVYGGIVKYYNGGWAQFARDAR